jgi:hypothetical protein
MDFQKHLECTETFADLGPIIEGKNIMQWSKNPSLTQDSELGVRQVFLVPIIFVLTKHLAENGIFRVVRGYYPIGDSEHDLGCWC